MNIIKYIPTKVENTVLDINYDLLKNSGIENLFFDIDNTLKPYNESIPSKEIIELSKKIKQMGFKVFLISNGRESRMNDLLQVLAYDKFYSQCCKPHKFKLNKILQENNINDTGKCCFIGDQMVTDILCGNKLGMITILVRTINPNVQHWYTKVNRLKEKKIINKYQNINASYAEKIKEIVGR